MEKIQEITDKIYREGIEKVNAEKEQIISSAKAEAEKIIDNAKAEAARIISEAQKQIAEKENQSMTTLRMKAAETLSKLKYSISQELTNSMLAESMSEISESQNLMSEILMKAIASMQVSDMGELLVRVSDSLLPCFRKKATALISRGLKVELADAGIKVGFEIVSVSGGYTVRFADEELENYFSSICSSVFSDSLNDNKSLS